MNEQAIWKLAEEGMAALTVERLAQETGQSALELGRLYPDPSFMVLALIEETHKQAMRAEVSPSSPLHDQVTDRVMAHLDISLSHQEAIRRLWVDLLAMPVALLTLRPYLMKMVDHILKESGMEEESLWYPIRLRAYFALFLYVLYVWLYDDSPQQEQTLVCLDKGLKRLGELPW